MLAVIPLRLEQLKYALEVAKCQSIKKASKNLYVTQQSLSQAMKYLEKELGFLLFHRTTNGITLTDEGKLFIEFAEKVLEEQTQLFYKIQLLHNSINNNLKGTLHLNIFGLYNVSILPEILNKFCSKYPQVTVKVVEMDLTEIETYFQNNNNDCIGMITLPSNHVEKYNAYLKEHALRFFPFAEGKYLLCCNKNHPLLKNNIFKITIKHATHYPIVHYSMGDSHNDTFHKILVEYGYSNIPIFLTTQSIHIWATSLLDGDKIGFLHEFIFEDIKNNHYANFNNLVAFPTKEPLEGALGYIIKEEHSELVEKFIEFLPKK